MTTTKTKAVAKRTAKSKAVAKAANTASLMQADAGDGTDQMTAGDFARPFIRVINALSPQLKKNDPAHIDGAEQGMIFDTVSSETWDGEEGVRVIPCHYRKTHVEWRPRNKGGGFVGAYDSEPKYLQEEGNELEETANYSVLVEGADGWYPALITLKRSGWQTARKWNSMISIRRVTDEDGNKFKPPVYGCVYRLTSVERSSPNGDYFAFGIEDTGVLTPDIEDGESVYGLAKAFSAESQTGFTGGNVEVVEGGTSEFSNDNVATDEDLPF